MERFRQGILVPLKDVSVSANDRLHFGDFVVGKVVTDLDRLNVERSGIWCSIRVVL
jgi:hypothetical protein